MVGLLVKLSLIRFHKNQVNRITKLVRDLGNKEAGKHSLGRLHHQVNKLLQMTAEVVGLQEGDAMMSPIIQLFLPPPVVVGLLMLIGWR